MISAPGYAGADACRKLIRKKGMKSTKLKCITGIALFTVLAIPVQLTAQEPQPNKQQPPLQRAAQRQKPTTPYTVTDLGMLGGTFGEALAVNNKGWVVGDATLPGDTVRRAFLWRKGPIEDLGTLGGPNSYAALLNERGDVTGSSDTSTPDPLGEDFCFFGTNLVCLPFVWQHGAMTPLPTLGGSNGGAASINGRGQVVGGAENAKTDPTCVGTSQILHVEPVLWEKGEIRELPTIAGDPDGFANAINDNGEAVGSTGDAQQTFTGCSGSTAR